MKRNLFVEWLSILELKVSFTNDLLICKYIPCPNSKIFWWCRGRNWTRRTIIWCSWMAWSWASIPIPKHSFCNLGCCEGKPLYSDFLVGWLVEYLVINRAGKIGEFISIHTHLSQRSVYIDADGGRVCRPLIIVENMKPRITNKHIKVFFIWFFNCLNRIHSLNHISYVVP